MRAYIDTIKKTTDRDPRLVMAWLRLDHGTLDHLGPVEFHQAVLSAIESIDREGEEESQALADSFGLPRSIASEMNF